MRQLNDVNPYILKYYTRDKENLNCLFTTWDSISNLFRNLHNQCCIHDSLKVKLKIKTSLNFFFDYLSIDSLPCKKTFSDAIINEIVDCV